MPATQHFDFSVQCPEELSDDEMSVRMCAEQKTPKKPKNPNWRQCSCSSLEDQICQTGHVHATECHIAARRREPDLQIATSQMHNVRRGKVGNRMRSVMLSLPVAAHKPPRTFWLITALAHEARSPHCGRRSRTIFWPLLGSLTPLQSPWCFVTAALADERAPIYAKPLGSHASHAWSFPSDQTW